MQTNHESLPHHTTSPWYYIKCAQCQNVMCKPLHQKCEANELLTCPEEIIEEMQVRPLLLGDGAHPSIMWFVKPYPSNI